MAKKKINHPRVIEGDPLKDNFFKYNYHFSIYPEIQSLINEIGEKSASDILWSYWYYLDIRSPLFDRKSDLERKRFINETFCDFDWNDELYFGIERFYDKNITCNDNIVHYRLMKRKFEQDGSSSVKAKWADKQALKEFKDLAYEIANEGEYDEIQGVVQPGLLARGRKK